MAGVEGVTGERVGRESEAKVKSHGTRNSNPPSKPIRKIIGEHLGIDLFEILVNAYTDS